LILEPKEVKKLIREHHGKKCSTYQYVNDWDMRTLIDEDDFKHGLLEEYLSILQKEYDYLTSEESIIESIQCNEYDFDINGNLQ